MLCFRKGKAPAQARAQRLPAHDIGQSGTRTSGSPRARTSRLRSRFRSATGSMFKAGMKCDTCHKAVGASGKMQIPGVADCMGCHQTHQDR